MFGSNVASVNYIVLLNLKAFIIAAVRCDEVRPCAILELAANISGFLRERYLKICLPKNCLRFGKNSEKAAAKNWVRDNKGYHWRPIFNVVEISGAVLTPPNYYLQRWTAVCAPLRALPVNTFKASKICVVYGISSMNRIARIIMSFHFSRQLTFRF